jgi:hypothetical protein
MTKRILYHYHGRGFSLSFRQRSFFSTRNLFVIPTEKFFSSTRNPVVIPTEKLFLLRRGISLSFRQRSFFLRRGISLSFWQRSFFASTRNLFVFDRLRFFSREKLLQNDTYEMSFRMRSFFTSTRNLFVIPTEKFFCFDEESLCFRQAKILQSLNSSFRMTLTKCHSEWEVFLLWWGIYLSFRQRSFLLRRGIYYSNKEPLCFS